MEASGERGLLLRTQARWSNDSLNDDDDDWWFRNNYSKEVAELAKYEASILTVKTESL